MSKPALLYCLHCFKEITEQRVLCPTCKEKLRDFALDIVTISYPKLPSEFAPLRGKALNYPVPDVPLDILECEETLKYNPDNTEALLHMGMFYKSRGQIDLALKEFNKVLEKTPQHADAHRHLADIYMHQHNVPAATRELEKLKFLEGQNEMVLFNLGLAYLLGGSMHLGRHQLQLALKYGHSKPLKTKITELLDQLSKTPI